MPTKIYLAEETTVVWTDTGGDYTLDLGGLAADAVRVGQIGDLGATPRSRWYEYKMIIDGFATAPVVGETVLPYLSFSDQATAGREDGDVGVADAVGATAALPNLRPLRPAVVQTTTAGDELIVSGYVEITSRYVIPAIHNNTTDAFASSGDAHRFELTPVPYEIQD